MKKRAVISAGTTVTKPKSLKEIEDDIFRISFVVYSSDIR